MNTACDKNCFVLGVHVSAGNIHDSINFAPIFDQVHERFPEMKTVVADAGYITPQIAKHCFDNKVRPVLAYKRPMTKKGFFKKYEFVYDEYYDQYICPNEQLLEFKRITREGHRMYISNPEQCKSCPYLKNCTESQNHKKVILRHIWTSYLEEANHLRHTDYNRKTYSLRAQTIERVFADYKEKHGMRYTQYRGITKVRDEALLSFACMNLKKLATWKWKKIA